MQDDVTRSTKVAATPEHAWRSLTEPDGLEDWLGEALELELEPGGDLRLRLPGGEERSGWVETVEPEERLAFWWSQDGEDATRVELELEEVDGGTLVTVTESRPLAVLELQAAEIADGGAPGSGPVMLAGAR